MATIETILTADEFLRLPDQGTRQELVRGKLKEMNVPGFEHGLICGRIHHALASYLDQQPLGRVISNDAGVVTERNPDSVRGADVAYYSFERLPQQARPRGYPDLAPEIVFEIRSPTDRWSHVLRKVAEYLDVNVLFVCVVDPVTERINVYTADRPEVSLGEGDTLTFPDLLPDFSLPLSRVFQ
jgi:Uma2 family endonuclease